jgi:hypothetical protein
MQDSMVFGTTISQRRKEREKEKKRRRDDQKKRENISLLEFTRQVVEMTFRKHGETEKVIPQKEATAMLGPGVKEVVRYDSGRHLIKFTTVMGVCQECRNRTPFRCDRCCIALHPKKCFFNYYVQEDEKS